MKKFLILILAASVGLSSCLDKTPLSQMSPDTFFSNANELEAFSNTFYTMFPAASLYSENADNIIGLELTEEVRGVRLVPASGGGWSWTALREVNTMLGHIHNCEDEDVRKEFEAVGRFFRAYFYFEKVRRFGDVPWVDKELSSTDEALYKPRDSREFVMGKILEDIDYAIEYLPQTKHLYKISKWTALALKSRICLFEGTFRKYHALEIEGGNTWQWYLEQCVKASDDFMSASGYGIYNVGGSSAAYRNLFLNVDSAESEVILARDYNKALGVFHNSNYYTLGQSYGRPGITRKIVASYLMSDGSRFTDKTGWETMQFAQETKNRDPRLAQSMRTPGYTRHGKTEQLAPDFTTCVTGYQPTKYVGGSDHDGYNKSYLDLIMFRSAEVYLNFAEAKAELGTLTQADLDKSVKKIRERVGMPALNMSQANANPDEKFLGSSEYGYSNVTGANKGVILEIRRERTIELLGEGHRYYDMMRWKEGKAFEQKLLGMYFPGPGEYDLDGNGSLDLCLYKGTKPSSKAAVFLEINQDILLEDGNSGCVFPHKGNQGSWNEERDYLYPIPTDDRSLTNGALKQNPGWNDGLDL